MATPARSVTCPECAAPKTTKANRGVRLVCASCGTEFRCPAPPAEPVAELPSAPAPPAPGNDDRATVTAEPASAVTVARGRPVITQTARPRSRGTDTPKKGADQAPAPSTRDAAPGEPDPPEPEPPGSGGQVHREAGRRGGLATYAKRRNRR